jgi:hypothetical protein
MKVHKVKLDRLDRLVFKVQLGLKGCLVLTVIWD